MAGFKRPSFLKKQKEQKRVAKAAEKRAARQARREASRNEEEPTAGLAEITDDAEVTEESAEGTQAAED